MTTYDPRLRAGGGKMPVTPTGKTTVRQMLAEQFATYVNQIDSPGAPGKTMVDHGTLIHENLIRVREGFEVAGAVSPATARLMDADGRKALRARRSPAAPATPNRAARRAAAKGRRAS